MPKLKRFLVRTNCEYSIEVDAADADEATRKADTIDLSEWNESWAEFEAEEE